MSVQFYFMYTTTTLYYIPFTLAAVYHPRLDEHSLQRRLLGPAVPLWDPVDSTEPRIYLSIYLRYSQFSFDVRHVLFSDFQSDNP